MTKENGKTVFYKYLDFAGVDIFTVICLPSGGGKFPTVIYRTPYVDYSEKQTEEEICAEKLNEYKNWLDNGYAVVFQHCRGRGKSSGDCVPFIYEREDGISLQNWIRSQDFYNGELYLCGISYTASVHFVTAPFAEDIKGAVLEVQDCERYNCIYRNGFYKMGLHGCWYVDMYKKKGILKKSFTPASFNMLPLTAFSKTVFGERAEDFDEILKHPDKNDAFWNTRYGGAEAHIAVKHADIPILLVTGFYDIYTGGIFDMWNSLDSATKAKSALAVHPFEHDGRGDGQPVVFKDAALGDAFNDYAVRWINSVRGKEAAPFESGKVTYYKLFGDEWCTDCFEAPEERRVIPLGGGEVRYCYNPYDPASFKGGLSANFGGAAWQDSPNSRYDIISLYTPEFTEKTFVKGKLTAKLRVKFDCEDTCFYMRISLCKAEGDYGLRDDINQISNLCADYTPGKEVDMTFSFDEHAFAIQAGEKLRIDISSSAYPHYVRHTNNKGLFSEQTTAKIAVNTVVLDESYIEIPICLASAEVKED